VGDVEAPTAEDVDTKASGHESAFLKALCTAMTIEGRSLRPLPCKESVNIKDFYKYSYPEQGREH